MKAIWSIACLDLLLWRRMPIAMLSALIPPVAMALFLVVLSMAVTQQPVAMVVQSHGKYADMMADIIRSDNDAYLLSETDAATARKLLDNQEVAAVITVPEDFEKLVDASQVASVKLLLNNVDTDFADDIRRSVDRSVYRFALERNTPPTAEEMKLARVPDSGPESAADEARENEILMRRVRGENVYLIKIDEHDLRETNVQWLNYQVIPALILLVLNVGLVGTALLCAHDIEKRTATYLVLSPQNSLTLVLGKLLGGFLACMIALVPALALCALTGTISPPSSHWLPLVAIFAATALFSAGVGAIIGATIRGARAIAMAACVLATYLFFLGGGFTTIAFLPEWLRTLSSCVPTRYAIDGMRQCLFYSTLDGVVPDLMSLTMPAILCCVLGAYFVRSAWVK